MPGEPGEGVGGPLRILQQHMLGYLQLERSRGDSVPGQARGDGAREAGCVDIARGDVDGHRDPQPLGPPAGDLSERGLQHVLRQMGHQPGGLGDRYELVRRHLPALGMHPAHQRLQAGDLSVEADLGLVVQLHFVGVQGPAQIAQQAQPVGGVGVPLGLVDLDARTVPLRLVHRHVRPPQQPLGVQGVVGEDGNARAGLQDEGEPVEVERRTERGDEAAGDARGRCGGVGDGQ